MEHYQAWKGEGLLSSLDMTEIFYFNDFIIFHLTLKDDSWHESNTSLKVRMSQPFFQSLW